MPIVQGSFTKIANLLQQFQAQEANLNALAEEIANEAAAANVAQFNSDPAPHRHDAGQLGQHHRL